MEIKDFKIKLLDMGIKLNRLHQVINDYTIFLDIEVDSHNQNILHCTIHFHNNENNSTIKMCTGSPEYFLKHIKFILKL